MSITSGNNYELPSPECYAVVVPRRMPIVARAERLPEHGFVLDEQTFKPMLPYGFGRFISYLWGSDDSLVGFIWNEPDMSPAPDNNDYRIVAMLTDRPYCERDGLNNLKFVLDNHTSLEDVRVGEEEMMLELMTFQGDRGDQAFAVNICFVEHKYLGLLNRDVTLLEETITL